MPQRLRRQPRQTRLLLWTILGRISSLFRSLGERVEIDYYFGQFWTEFRFFSGYYFGQFWAEFPIYSGGGRGDRVEIDYDFGQSWAEFPVCSGPCPVVGRVEELAHRNRLPLFGIIEILFGPCLQVPCCSARGKGEGRGCSSCGTQPKQQDSQAAKRKAANQEVEEGKRGGSRQDAEYTSVFVQKMPKSYSISRMSLWKPRV